MCLAQGTDRRGETIHLSGSSCGAAAGFAGVFECDDLRGLWETPYHDV